MFEMGVSLDSGVSVCILLGDLVHLSFGEGADLCDLLFADSALLSPSLSLNSVIVSIVTLPFCTLMTRTAPRDPS